MDWDAVEKVLYNMHCRACDGYQCDHGDRVAEALAELKEIAAQHHAHLTPQRQEQSQAVVNASALEQSDNDTPPSQAQVV